MSHPGGVLSLTEPLVVAPVGPVYDVLRVGVLGFGEPVIRAYVVGREDVYAACEGAVKILSGVHFTTIDVYVPATSSCGDASRL